MGFLNYYELLGVNKRATVEEIKRAYRKKIRRWHPDANPKQREVAEDMTKALNEAYSILNNSKKREEYDRLMGFSRFYAQAGTFMHTRAEEIDERQFWEKLRSASTCLSEIREDLLVLYDMFKDGIRGSYRISSSTKGLLAGAFLYLLSTFDMIPDFLPLLGFTDDATLLTLLINHLQRDLKQYKAWKRGA